MSRIIKSLGEKSAASTLTKFRQYLNDRGEHNVAILPNNELLNFYNNSILITRKKLLKEKRQSKYQLKKQLNNYTEIIAPITQKPKEMRLSSYNTKQHFKNVIQDIQQKQKQKRLNIIHNIQKDHHNQLIQEIKHNKNQNGLTIQEMVDEVENRLGDINTPFEITLLSAVINLKRKFRFTNMFHFIAYWEKVLNSGEVIDYDYTNTFNFSGITELPTYAEGSTDTRKHTVNPLSGNLFKYIPKSQTNEKTLKSKIKQVLQKSDQNVFRYVVISNITIIEGGCNKHTKTDKTLTTPFYEYTLFNPVSMANNCFFKCLDKVLETKLDIKKIRKELNLTTNTKIDIEQAYQIISYVKSNVDSTKNIYIIDWEQNEELNESDAYILIKDEHYYVVESFKEIILKDKKTKRGLLTFDFETRPTEEYYLIKASNTKSYILQDTICGVYYKEYSGGKYDAKFSKQMLITNKEKSSARQFIDWLNNETKRGKSYNIIAHNGGNFDFYFIVENMTEQELKDCQIQMRGTTIISINYKGHLFKDSYCFMTFSLETLSTNFKIEEGKMTKLKINGETISSTQLCFYKSQLTFNEFLDLQENDKEFWINYEEYCIRDCIALYQIWGKFTDCVNNLLSTINPYLLKTCPLMSASTIGSHSKKILNTLNQSSKKYSWIGEAKRKMEMFFKDGENNVDFEKYKYLGNFKRGGISHCHKAGLHTNGIAPVDIKSQYPASLIYSRIPVGLSQWTNDYDKTAFGFYHLKNLVFETDHIFKPVAMKKSNGVLEWNTGNFIDNIFIDTYMIKYLQEYYGLKTFDVVNGLISFEDMKAEKLFGKYVNTFYKEKQRQDMLKDIENEKNQIKKDTIIAKYISIFHKDVDEYNPALRETIKLYLNALTGKLVEDPDRHFSLKFDENSTKKLNGVGVEKEFNEGKYNEWLIAGIMVYSYSKRLLFEYIRCLPKDSNSVIHIETDGIYFDMRDKNEFDKNLINYQSTDDFPCVKYGDELGNLDYEKSKASVKGQPAYFLGKKFYCITSLSIKGNKICDNNTCKVKGIPKATIDDNGKKIKLVDVSLYENIFEGKSVLKHFKTLQRHLYGDHTQISSHTASRTINPNSTYKLWV